MCKMAPMVGKDITERLILPRFCEMCCDCRMFHVRKVGLHPFLVPVFK